MTPSYHRGHRMWALHVIYPAPIYTMCDIIVNLSISLNDRSNILKTSSFWMTCVSSLIFTPASYITLLDLHSKYFVLIHLINLNPLDFKVYLKISSLTLTLTRILSIRIMSFTNNRHHDTTSRILHQFIHE